MIKNINDIKENDIIIQTSNSWCVCQIFNINQKKQTYSARDIKKNSVVHDISFDIMQYWIERKNIRYLTEDEKVQFL